MSLEHRDIRFLCVSPHLLMVSVSEVKLEQVRAILKIDYDGACNKQLLGYNTQFNLGKSSINKFKLKTLLSSLCILLFLPI